MILDAIPPEYIDPLMDTYHIEGAPSPEEMKTRRYWDLPRGRNSKPFGNSKPFTKS